MPHALCPNLLVPAFAPNSSQFPGQKVRREKPRRWGKNVLFAIPLPPVVRKRVQRLQEWHKPQTNPYPETAPMPKPPNPWVV